MDYFSRKQVALVAINRLRNARRGHQITKGGREVKQGLVARPEQFFFTDEQHAKELVNNGSARWPEDFEDAPAWPGAAGPQEQPIVKVTEAQMPKYEAIPVGQGYYDISADGVVVQQIKTKAAASKMVKKLEKEWKAENLPDDQAADSKPVKAEL